MNINATLLGQMITFGLFVWFTMKFVWPLLDNVLKLRNQKIAEGLQAAEHGHKELELAKKLAVQEIREARAKAALIVDRAHEQATFVLESAKTEAIRERAQILAAGYLEIEQQKQGASDQLRSEAVSYAVLMAEKLLGRTMNEVDQQYLLDNRVVRGDG